MEQRRATAVLLVSLVIGSSMAAFHTCIHDKVAVDTIPTVQLSTQQLQQNTTEFRSIRITPQIVPGLDIRLLGLVTSPSGALARAIQTIVGSLMVRPIQSNFTIPYPCTQWTSGPNKGKCMPSRGDIVAQCGPLPIPTEFVGGWDTCATATSIVCNRTQAQGPGANNTDFLLFVGSTNDSSCNSAPLVFSYAASCAKDAWFRPAAGYINFCANKLLQQPPGLVYDLILHELIHALGFSARRFQDFHDGTLNFYRPNASFLFAKQSVPALSSPKVLAVARSYFSCPGLSSIPLENNGASRSHWESRILHHETMTAFLPEDYTTLSNFTLAYFEDSGWYRVNYTYVSTIRQFELRWGQGLGCSFVTDSCNNSRTYPYLCNIIQQQGCTFDRGAKGVCRKDNTFFDGCPIVLAGLNSTCLSSAASEVSGLGTNSICVQVNSTVQNCLPTSGTPGCYDRKVLKEISTGMIAYNLSVNGSNIVCSDSQVVQLDHGFVLCPSRSEILLRTTVVLAVTTLPTLRRVVIPSARNVSTYGIDTRVLSICGYPVTCTEYGALKLVGGPNPYEGQLQTCLNGMWMTVCSTGFTNDAAKVACRQMGLSTIGATLLYSYSLPQSYELSIAYTYTSCAGSENTLLDCSHSCPSYYSCYYGCFHSMDIGIKCKGPCIENETRIIQADNLGSTGAVQVCKNGVWGGLCAPTWGYKEASVVCKQNAYFPYGAIPGRTALVTIAAPVPNYTAVLNCTDKSINLSDCTNGVGFKQSPDCNSGVAWVKCFTNINLPPVPCQDGSVRLRNGYLDTEGRVEVCINRAWGTVCSFGFDQAEASIICRQLGYYPVGTAKLYSTYGNGNGPIILSNLVCNGFESSLLECTSSGLGISDGCSHYHDAGVICSTTTPPDNCTLGNIRLVGGNASGGEVQVCYGNLWSSVCYTGWENRDAGVVCKQLGFTAGGQGMQSNFSIGRREIFAMEMDCTGVEKTITQCPKSGSSCNSRAAAAVICNDPEPTNVTCADGDIRLRNGATANEGRVEVCYSDQWGPVCDGAWNYQKAVVTCRQLGLIPYGATPYSNAYFGVGSGLPLMQLQWCSGSEESLVSCSHTPLGSTPSCGITSEVGVHCLVQGSICTNGSARLVNGDRNNTGRVEVCRYGLWGTICDTDWNAAMAAVACLQIGYRNGLGAVPRYNSIYGQGSGPVWIPRISCSGDERSLFDCTTSMLDAQTCSHFNDAGVECPTPEPTTNCTNGALRLMYGSTSLNGRLEICYRGLWGTVCSGHYSSEDNWHSFATTWSNTNANVACKQLGYAPIGASWTTAYSNPTQDTRGILLSDVSCSGTETALQNCTHSPIGIHRCDHDHDVILYCQASQSAFPTSSKASSTAFSSRVFSMSRSSVAASSTAFSSRVFSMSRSSVAASSTVFSSNVFSPSLSSAAASFTVLNSKVLSWSLSSSTVLTSVSSPAITSSTSSVQGSSKTTHTWLHSVLVLSSIGAISAKVSTILQPTQLQGETQLATMAHTVGIAVGIICAILFIVLVVLVSALTLVIIRKKSTIKKDFQHGDKEEMTANDSNDAKEGSGL